MKKEYQFLKVTVTIVSIASLCNIHNTGGAETASTFTANMY